MDEFVGCMFLLFLFIIMLGYLFQGIAWLITNELPLVVAVLAAVAIVPMVYWYSRLRKIGEETAKIESLAKKANAAEKRATAAIERIKADRPAVQKSNQELDNVRLGMRGEALFSIMVQQHHTSRLAADAWYDHMQDAITSRRAFVGEIDNFAKYINDLTSNSKQKNTRPDKLIFSARGTISYLRTASLDLQEEISRSRQSLDSHNNGTKDLKLHIRDNCGVRGLRWFNELEQRTAMRKLTE